MSGEDALRDAHNQLRREAREQRRAFARSEAGGIARQLGEAMAEYHRMRAQGVSQEDACRGLEAVLRDVFPLSKYPPACSMCEDSGYRELVCWSEQRCGRRICADRPEMEHRYVIPCDCAKGDAKRKRSYTPDDAIAQVGRVKKSKGFSRFGN